MRNWMVEIHGRGYIIQELTELFSSSRLTVEKEANSYRILSSEFDSLTAPDDVRSRATELLTLINAISKLRFAPGIFKPVKMSDTVYRIGKDGTSVEVFKLVGTEATLLWKGSASTPHDEVEQWCDLAMNDPKVQEVFYYFQEETTALSLRKVYELIADDFKGQPSAVEKHLGVKKEDIERFKTSVEDPRHSGRRAIHAPTKKYTKGSLKHSRMSLEEAQVFIGKLVRKWLLYRAA